MTAFRPPPERHWRSYGIGALPTPAEALDEPLSAFPSWFLKITCDRCGKATLLRLYRCASRGVTWCWRCRRR